MFPVNQVDVGNHASNGIPLEEDSKCTTITAQREDVSTQIGLYMSTALDADLCVKEALSVEVGDVSICRCNLKNFNGVFRKR